ncbi:MAG: RidA family protein [Flavobacteriaceae bacterium]
MTETVEDRLSSAGLSLPAAAAPVASYVPTARSGNLLFVSGQITTGPSGVEFIGRCGEQYGIDEGQAAARLCALNVLAQVKAALGSLEKVRRCLKLTGFVNSTPDFTDHPKVINGASDIMIAAFGEKGRHARAAVGVASLPLGVAVEVEAIFEVE